MGETYKAAFSQVDITPEYPTILVGRNRPYPSQGVLHRIYAQALLFQSENEVFCLIAIDSLGFTIPLANILRSKVAALLNTDTSHVMLNFSHTHSAPEPTPYALNGEKYFGFLCGQIETCVESAKKSFRTCKISWALTTTSIGENRRSGGAAVDNRLGALMVAGEDNGKPIMVMARIAAHPNILPGTNYNVSGDFISIARDELQHFFECSVMIIQGASGNIKAAGTNDIGEGDDGALYRVADILVDSVKRLRFELREISDIKMFSTEMSCVADVPTREESEKIAPNNQYGYIKDWLDACEELRRQGIETQQSNVEINFFKLNEGCICGVPDEIFCEPALDIQERANNPFLFFNGYTNGCTGYLPSREEWYKGGYEVVDSYFIYHKYSGRVMPYRAETADRIVDLVINEWGRIR